MTDLKQSIISARRKRNIYAFRTHLNLNVRYRYVTFIIVSLLLLPTVLTNGNAASGPEKDRTNGRDGAYPAAFSDKSSSMEINDFSGMEMDHVVARPQGGIALQMERGDWRNEFQAVWKPWNTYNPVIVTNSKNQYIIGWTEDRNTSGCVVFFQRFDERANKLGEEVRVASCPGSAYYQTLAMSVSTRDILLVAYATERNETGHGIYLQRFDAEGNRLGVELEMPGTDRAFPPLVMAVNFKNKFMIAWNDLRDDNTTVDLGAVILDPNGQVLADNITVRKGTGYQDHPSIAALTDGRFVVAWTESRSPDYRYKVYAQFIEDDGTIVDSSLVVSGTGGDDYIPRIAANMNNSFCILWDNVAGSPQQSSIRVQQFDASGTSAGREITVATGRWLDAIAVNSSSNILVLSSEYSPGGYDIYAQWLDPGGNRSGEEAKLTTNISRWDNLIVAIDSKDDVLVAWEEHVWGIIYARQFIKPYFSSGFLKTDDLSPPHFWSWSNLSVNLSLPRPSNNSLSFSFSTDGGASWQAVPPNGSLAGAGQAQRIRLRVDFATTDDLWSPILYNMTLRYIANRQPVVSLPPDLVMWKKDSTNITADAIDPDGDFLTYNWVQTAGPGYNLNRTTAPILFFRPEISGIYGFQVIVTDGYNASLPVRINITVKNRHPIASLLVAPSSQLAETPMIFNATGSFDPDDNVTSYNFSFGDGNSSGWVTESSIPHIYPSVGVYNANLSVMDEEGAINTSADVVISIALPDLVIHSYDIKISPGRPEAGYTLLFSVDVHNRGQWQAGAFRVRFSIDNRTTLPDVEVLSLDKGGNLTVKTKWTAVAGSHRLRVLVNPDNSLRELDTSNNDAVLDFSVTKKASITMPDVIACVAAFLILAAIVCAIMFKRLRKPAAVVADKTED